MEQVLELRTVKITSKGQIAIPRSLREKSGFHEGDRALIVVFKDRLEILSESRMNSILSEASLGKEWLSVEEDEAWKDL